ncbi:MAG: hypothetical protein Fur005_17810 [Roseiflexaceae bacterium]
MPFSHREETQAAPGRIWEIWVDVANWPLWDTELISAEMEGPFQLGQQGRLQAKGSPPARFVISAYEAGQSYTFRTDLPFAQLHMRRDLHHTGITSFTHTVSFTGTLGWLFGLLLGSRYQTALPKAMQRIREHAEAR